MLIILNKKQYDTTIQCNIDPIQFSVVDAILWGITLPGPG